MLGLVRTDSGRRRTPRLASLGVLAAIVAAAGPAVAAKSEATAAKAGCTGVPSHVLSTSKPLGLKGFYALPAKAPQALVVFAHGYRSWSGAWKKAMVDAAAHHGAVAVAVDYRGLGSAAEGHRGWPVQNGAADLTKAITVFRHLCPTAATTAVFSVGMGGDAAGLAIARGDKAAKPLVNYWVDVEGATNLFELWTSLSAVGGVCLPSGTCLPGMDTYYAVARSDLEAETGGPPYEAASGYQSRDALTQLKQDSALHLKGAAIVHAVADGSVLYTEGAETAAALHAQSVPTDSYTVLRGNGGPDQTIVGDTNGQTGAGKLDPMAGYEPDGALGDITIKTGLDALWGMVDHAGAKPANNNYVVDSQLGRTP